MKTLSSLFIAALIIVIGNFITPTHAIACPVTPSTEATMRTAQTHIATVRHPSKRTLELQVREGWKPRIQKSKVGY